MRVAAVGDGGNMRVREWVFCSALFLVWACGARVNEAEPTSSPANDMAVIDSESHFLSVCSGDCAEGFRCVCGVCTQLCSETDDCTTLGEGVDCVAPTPLNPDSCAGQVVHKVCDQHCESSADCDAGSSCSAGACRRAPDPAPDCPEAELPACDAGEELHTTMSEGGCAGLSCVPKSVCRLPFFEPDAARCEAPPTERYWFNSARGRCEVEMTGGCGESANAFTSAEECWSTCAPDNGAECLEVWNPYWQSAEFTPSGNVPELPIALTREQATDLVLEHYSARLTYPDTTQTELELSIAGAVSYSVQRSLNPGSTVGHTLSIPPQGWVQCPDSVSVEADVRLSTADGRFDEAWSGLNFDLGQRTASAFVDVWVTGDWAPIGQQEVLLQGSYRPALTSDQCSLSSGLELLLVAGAARGRVNHSVVDLPCSEVELTTPISSPPEASNPLPMLPTPPSGPVWNSLILAPQAQFCAAADPVTGGLREPAANEAFLALSEPATELVFSDVLEGCSDLEFSRCAPEALLSLGAAECVARASGFEAGVAAWSTGLASSYEDGAIWTLRNTLLSEASGAASGEELTLHATTGEVLGKLGWRAQP
jgi:Kunitz/Bovine pancreatic trypsin inhibitor domain